MKFFHNWFENSTRVKHTKISKLGKEAKVRILQVHSQESNVRHNGMVKYQSFPSESLPKIGLTKVSLRNIKTILKQKSMCVNA